MAYFVTVLSMSLDMECIILYSLLFCRRDYIRLPRYQYLFAGRFGRKEMYATLFSDDAGLLICNQATIFHNPAAHPIARSACTASSFPGNYGSILFIHNYTSRNIDAGFISKQAALSQEMSV